MYSILALNFSCLWKGILPNFWVLAYVSNWIFNTWIFNTVRINIIICMQLSYCPSFYRSILITIYDKSTCHVVWKYIHYFKDANCGLFLEILFKYMIFQLWLSNILQCFIYWIKCVPTVCFAVFFDPGLGKLFWNSSTYFCD